MALFGRTKQFRQSLEANWARLYRVAYSWTHEPFIAHDLVQETIARALQHKDKIIDHTALEIWLFKVMANYWRDLLRRRKDSVDINDAQLVDPDTPESHTERANLILQVRNAISRLNQEQRSRPDTGNPCRNRNEPYLPRPPKPETVTQSSREQQQLF